MSFRPTFLYKADDARGRVLAEVFAQHAPWLEFRMWPDVGEPQLVHYLLAWEPPANLEAQFPNLKVLFSIGAGLTSSISIPFPLTSRSCA